MKDFLMSIYVIGCLIFITLAIRWGLIKNMDAELRLKEVKAERKRIKKYFSNLKNVN